MSLINQMLKDLETRRQQENHGEQKVTVAPCYQKPQRPSALLIVAVVIVLTGSCFGGWWYVIRKPQVPPGAVVQVNPAVSENRITGHPVPVEADSVPVRIEPETIAQIEAVVPPSALALAELKAKPEAVVVIPPVPAAQGAPELGQQAVEIQPVAPVAIAVAEPVCLKSTKPVAAVQVSQAVSVPEQAQQIRVQAQRMLDQHKYPEVVKLLQQAVTLAGATPTQWHQLAVAYLQARQLAAACQAADSGCQQYPGDVALRVLQARLLLETGNKHQALAALQLIVPAPAVASASDYYALLATVQQQNGDFVAAQKNYVLLCDSFPQRGEWWIGRAICADQSGQQREAAACFQQALRCPQLQPQLKQYALQQLQRLAKG